MVIDFERPFVRRLKKTNPEDPKSLAALEGTWFVTSPRIYNRYLKRSTEGLSEARAKSVQAIKEHYEYILQNSTLIKRFATGAGSPVEVYQLKGLAQDAKMTPMNRGDNG